MLITPQKILEYKHLSANIKSSADIYGNAVLNFAGEYADQIEKLITDELNLNPLTGSIYKLNTVQKAIRTTSTDTLSALIAIQSPSQKFMEHVDQNILKYYWRLYSDVVEIVKIAR